MANAQMSSAFHVEPRNRYAAERMGVAYVRNAPDAASDVHRLASRLVMGIVVVVALAATAFVLPSAFGAVEGVASVFDKLAPLH